MNISLTQIKTNVYSGEDRRILKERRDNTLSFTGLDRRKSKDRRKNKRITIFVKFAVLSLLQILIIVTVVGLTMLNKQKDQFTEQLISFGVSLIKLAAQNSPDKLLGEEDFALFQLLNDIADNEQVAYILVVDTQNIIRAHNRIEFINNFYEPPDTLENIENNENISISKLFENGNPLLFFKQPLTYQNTRVGNVYLALSQESIINAIRTAGYSIGIFALIVLIIGLITSIFVSLYLSKPIVALKESAQIIGDGDFSHRVNINRHDELGDLGMAFNKMAFGLGERELIRETFGKYVSPEIRDRILSGDIPLDGERREATLLFSDLRGFTPFVEKNKPEEVIRSMRSYFSAMQVVIKKHGGLVLQYVGDEIEAVFGVPIIIEDHAERAVRAALDMRIALDELNQIRKTENLDPFRHGIGIYTGEVLAGNTGSDDRLSYTLIGDTVNLASRIQSMTKNVGCDILVHEGTVERIGKEWNFVKEEPQFVKGYSKPIVVYRMLENVPLPKQNPLMVESVVT